MNKKNFLQLTLLFLVITIATVLFFYFSAKNNFNGLCSNQYLEPTYSCSFWQSFSPTLWAILLVWFIVYIIVAFIITLTKKLNNYGFYGRPGGGGGPFAIFSFFRALYRWVSNKKPTGYPADKNNIKN